MAQRLAAWNRWGRYSTDLDGSLRSSETDYALWIEANSPGRSELANQREADQNHAAPIFSVVLAVADTPVQLLAQSAASVLGQTYQQWELLITGESPRARSLAARVGDVRVRTVDVGLARGDFVVILRGGDELAPHALFTVAAQLRATPGAAMLYSDEDTISAHGTREQPCFKPDFAPDLLLSTNYIGGLLALRRDILEQAGGFRAPHAPSEAYQLVLRATLSTPRASIVHIPDVLYHCRAEARDTPEAMAGSLDEHLKRTLGEDYGSVRPGAVTGVYDTCYAVRERSLVSIIIPTRDRADLLARCLTSLGSTSYPRYEILLVDNGSQEETARALLERAVRESSHVRVLSYPHPFNYADLNNTAVRAAQGEVIVLLNNDTELLTPGWLETMLGHAQQPRVGVVGAQLLYPTGSMQHAGIVLGADGVAGHAFRFLPPGRHSYAGYAHTIRNYSAVTAACMMVRRSVWEEVGGMDERFAVAYNDVDFCLRVGAAGYDIVYTPRVVLRHHESMSVGRVGSNRQIDHEEMALMHQRWGPALAADPFYNPNLVLSEEFRILAGPRRVAPAR